MAKCAKCKKVVSCSCQIKNGLCENCRKDQNVPK